VLEAIHAARQASQQEIAQKRQGVAG
jgi:hypothetical protein